MTAGRKTPNAQRPTPNVEISHCGAIAGRCAFPKKVRRKKFTGTDQPSLQLRLGRRVTSKAGKRRTLNVQRPMSNSITAERSRAVALSKYISESCRSQFLGSSLTKVTLCGALKWAWHTCRSYHFVVAGWRTKKAESRARENDNSRINQFNEPLALPVAPSKWFLDRQSLEIRTGSMCG